MQITRRVALDALLLLALTSAVAPFHFLVMDSFPGAVPPLATQLAIDKLLSPTMMRAQFQAAGEQDLGPSGVPTQAITDDWLQAYSDLMDTYIIPILNPQDENWTPPRTHILLAETVSEMVLRLKDTRHFFTPHNLRARKTIPALLSLYVLMDGYDDSELLAEQPPVSGSRVQELIFGVLAMYIVSLGDRVTVRGQKEPVGALADEELGLATILDAFLSASDGKSRYT